MSCIIIPAREEHTELILDFIRQLAVYEKMEKDVVATLGNIRHHLFKKKSAHCVLAFEEDIAVGFALYFYNFSTFLGKQGLYLEDLFVVPAHRGKGYGKKLLLYIAQTALENNCGRMEWSVLNWNQPAIDFYESLGAVAMHEWMVYRLSEEKLKSHSYTE
jgi:GNAT superfamily N-acetyltransferase